MVDQRASIVRLSIALGFKHRAMREIVSLLPNPVDVGRREVLERLPLRRELIESIERVDDSAVETILRRMERKSIRLLTIADKGYPPLLRTTGDAPAILFARGELDVTAAPSICIVGSRRASREGIQFASRIAGELSSEGFLIASGLARGIDRAAHRGVLDAGGETAAVLGCGPDIVYPHLCRREYDRIVEHGVVLSELLPGTEPRREFFPRRNRIMSGMSIAVIVVEAARRSGALITADIALEEGREVFAVPGSPVNPVSRGTNDLIRQGAHMVESTDDVLRELEYTGGAVSPNDGEDGEIDLACCLAGGPKNIDELSRLTGMNPAVILTRLAEMELAGTVTQVPGLRYTLSKSA